MISEIPNTNEAVVPGSKVILTADEKKISIDCTGDYVSLVGLCGVFIADMLTDIAFMKLKVLMMRLKWLKSLLKSLLIGLEKLRKEV